MSVKRCPSNFSFIIGGSIGDQDRVGQTLQLHSMVGVLVIKNVSVKLFSFFNGGSIGEQELCQTLQSAWQGVLVIKNVSVKLFSFFNGGSIGDQERVCPNFTASSTEGVLVMKNVSVKLFSFINGGSIGDQERVCQTLQLHQWREYW